MTALIDTNHRYQSAHYKAARASATNICTHRALVTGGKETKHYTITSFIHTIVLKELPRSLLGIWVANSHFIGVSEPLQPTGGTPGLVGI